MHYFKLVTVLLLLLATYWQVVLLIKVIRRVRRKVIGLGLGLVLGATAFLTFRRALNIHLSEVWMMTWLCLYAVGWNIIGMWMHDMIGNGKYKKKGK